MPLKKPVKSIKTDLNQAAEDLANQLADRPYGAQKNVTKTPESLLRTSITLPENLFRKIEDYALHNKRAKQGPKSVSAVIRDALDIYVSKYKI